MVLNAMQAAPPTPQSLVAAAGSLAAAAADPHHMAQLHVQTAMPIMASGQFNFVKKITLFFPSIHQAHI